MSYIFLNVFKEIFSSNKDDKNKNEVLSSNYETIEKTLEYKNYSRYKFFSTSQIINITSIGSDVLNPMINGNPKFMLSYKNEKNKIYISEIHIQHCSSTVQCKLSLNLHFTDQNYTEDVPIEMKEDETINNFQIYPMKGVVSAPKNIKIMSFSEEMLGMENVFEKIQLKNIESISKLYFPMHGGIGWKINDDFVPYIPYILQKKTLFMNEKYTNKDEKRIESRIFKTEKKDIYSIDSCALECLRNDFKEVMKNVHYLDCEKTELVIKDFDQKAIEKLKNNNGSIYISLSINGFIIGDPSTGEYPIPI
jgi:hypothetical protein